MSCSLVLSPVILLEKGSFLQDSANLGCLRFGRTPLHEAVELGHQQVVEEILLASGKRLVSAPDA